MRKEFVKPKMEMVNMMMSFQTATAYVEVGNMNCGDYDPNCACDCNSPGNWDIEELGY